MPRPSHYSRFHHPEILGEEYSSLGCSLFSFLHSLFTSPLLGPNILVNTILRHPKPTFLLYCERPSFTLIQNNRQLYINLVKTCTGK
jgi:hypothetical protein